MILEIVDRGPEDRLEVTGTGDERDMSALTGQGGLTGERNALLPHLQHPDPVGIGSLDGMVDELLGVGHLLEPQHDLAAGPDPATLRHGTDIERLGLEGADGGFDDPFGDGVAGPERRRAAAGGEQEGGGEPAGPPHSSISVSIRSRISSSLSRPCQFSVTVPSSLMKIHHGW